MHTFSRHEKTKYLSNTYDMCDAYIMYEKEKKNKLKTKLSYCYHVFLQYTIIVLLCYYLYKYQEECL